VGDVHAFVDALQAFFGHLAAVAWGALALAVLLHVVKLALRVRAWQNILRAAYPGARLPYRSVFGAYVAGVGVNSITPARGGDLAKLYLVKHRLAGSSYPALGSTLVVETLFDFVVATVLLGIAIKLGLLPGAPDLPGIPAFDWSFVIVHPRIAAVVALALLAGGFLVYGWASRQVVAFRQKVSQGLAILSDREAFVRGVVSWQALSWVARIAGVYFFLAAFHIDTTFRTVVAVLVVQGLSTSLPFTPGGLGAQQAVLVFALAGTASRSAVLSFSVGMQLVTILVNLLLGFGAIALMLRTLRWRSKVGEVQGGEAAAGATPEPAAARSRSALPG
jgi:uncharacterized membrane protein YbhN (UPF0104 family)